MGARVSRKLPKSGHLDAENESRQGTTKADLIDAVYRRHGALTKAEAAEVVDAIFRTMKSTLQDGRSVRIRNFGAFEVTERSGRTGVNPASGKKIHIPAHTGLTFRPSRNLKTVIVDGDDEKDS
jgi:integration host factor subunit alpha